MLNRIIKNKNITRIGVSILILLVVFFIANSIFGSADAASSAPEVTFSNFFKPETWVQYISYMYLSVTSFILSIAGLALNYSIMFSLKISEFVDGLPGINQAWIVIRDIISMLFIFILLYTSIKVIIGKAQMSQVGKLIIGIIVAGFFINFSFVIIKTIIDATNMLALGIYNAIVPIGADGGISDVLMNITKQSGDAIKSGDWSFAKMLSVAFQQVAMTLFYGSLHLITAIMFIVGAAMFVLRTITLIGMIAASPFLAFNFINLPVLDKLFGEEGKSLWKKFTGAALFAPIFMLLMYIGLKILVSTGTAGSIESQIKSITDSASGTAGDNTVNAIKSIVMNLITYTIVMGFYLAALKEGKKAGITGADKILGMATKNLESNAILNGSTRYLRKGISTGASEAQQAVGRRIVQRLDSRLTPSGDRVALTDEEKQNRSRLVNFITRKDGVARTFLESGASRAVDKGVSKAIEAGSKNTGMFAETIRPIADAAKASYEKTSIARSTKAEAGVEKAIQKDKSRGENIQNAKDIASNFKDAYKKAAGSPEKMKEETDKLLASIDKLSESDKLEIGLDDVAKNPTLAAIIGKKYFDSKEKDEKTKKEDLDKALEARTKGIAEGLADSEGKANKTIISNFKSLDGEELRDLLFSTKEGSTEPYYKNPKVIKYLDTNTIKKLESAIGGTQEAKDIADQIIDFELGTPPVTVPGFAHMKKRENAGNWGIKERLIDYSS